MAAAFLSVCIPTASAATSRVPAIKVDATVGGDSSMTAYTGHVIMIGSTTYVGLREFADRHSGSVVSWNEKTRTASVKANGLTLTAAVGGKYIIANERALLCPEGVFIEDGKTYVPLRAIASAFGYRTEWNQSTFTASIIREREVIESGADHYQSSDLYWLSRIICAEAKGESFEGKLAVGTVVMNRVRSSKFPNTVYGVVFDKAGGVQFTPASNGTIYNSPDADSIAAAKLCLDGASGMSEDILFFLNAKLSNSLWIPNNRRYVMTIGGHDFYA